MIVTGECIYKGNGILLDSKPAPREESDVFIILVRWDRKWMKTSEYVVSKFYRSGAREWCGGHYFLNECEARDYFDEC